MSICRIGGSFRDHLQRHLFIHHNNEINVTNYDKNVLAPPWRHTLPEESKRMDITIPLGGVVQFGGGGISRGSGGVFLYVYF